ncbi:unnamed protein product [Rotaria socialis]|uniref:Uncharacterized protein n=1 Tax=Rotaria socialis TaxID=392032 RepID=A0A818NHG7_9BILA|nr:unnamed protein product [Rotaria socialis]
MNNLMQSNILFTLWFVYTALFVRPITTQLGSTEETISSSLSSRNTVPPLRVPPLRVPPLRVPPLRVQPLRVPPLPAPQRRLAQQLALLRVPQRQLAQLQIPPLQVPQRQPVPQQAPRQ